MSDYLNDDGSLRIEQWAKVMVPELADAMVPMYGTAAVAKSLVSNGQLGLDLVRIAAGRGFEPHTHPGDHLLICVEGLGTITYNGSIYPTRAGEVYLIEGSIPHAVGAITEHSILAVGAPHRPAGAADRMVLTEYDAIAADLGEIHCLVCDIKGEADHLRTRGCTHAPLASRLRCPVTDPDVAVSGDVLVLYGDVVAVSVLEGVLVVTVPEGTQSAGSVGSLANTLAAAGPIRADGGFTEEDVTLTLEAIIRMDP
jgi:quercetin dioxygenase-like cupin family protein